MACGTVAHSNCERALQQVKSNKMKAARRKELVLILIDEGMPVSDAHVIGMRAPSWLQAFKLSLLILLCAVRSSFV